jgi:hypothetical protein
MVDLSKQSDAVEKWMDENIQRFLAEHPELSPTSIALYSSPANGWISLCLDIFENPDSLRTSCPDYTHTEFALFECPTWSDEYESDSPIIKRHDSAVVRFKHEQGDEIFNRPFFDFLMRVINDYYHSQQIVFRPIWNGVQILDSHLYSFGHTYQPKNL